MNHLFPSTFHQAAEIATEDEYGRTVESLNDFGLFMGDRIGLSQDQVQELLTQYVSLANGPQEDKDAFLQHGHIPSDIADYEQQDIQIYPEPEYPEPENPEPGHPYYGANIAQETTSDEPGIPMNDNAPVGTVADYNPLWYQAANISEEEIMSHPSKMKFDDLFTHGIVGIGDTFFLEVELTENGQPVKKTASMTICGTSRTGKGKPLLPDMDTWIGDVQVGRLLACNGTTKMVDHLVGHGANLEKSHHLWSQVLVHKGFQSIGSLQLVKKAYHYWRDRKDVEAAEKGQHFRCRRPRAKGGQDVVCHKGVIGSWVNGIFVPEVNQDQYRPGG